MAPEQEPLEPAAPGDLDKAEGLDTQSFNQGSRDDMESAFDDFQRAEVEQLASEPPPAEHPAPENLPDKPPADKGMNVAESTPFTDEPRTSFKTLEEADRAYLESRKKMTEATTRAARLEREKDEAERRANEAIGLVLKAAQGGERTPPPPGGQPQPSLTKEELETKFFEDPVGFLFSLTEAANQDAIRRVEARTKTERQQLAVENLTGHTQKYFDETYSDLKPLESLVTEEIQRIWSDPEIIRPILADNSRRIDAKAKAVVDEASRRVRERIPGIMQGLGAQVSGQPTKERLTSGAPPLVPGGGRSGPSVRLDSGRSVGETPEEYLAGREKRLERMQVTNWTR